MLKRLAVFVTAVMCIAVLSAQRVDRTVVNSITEYFNEYTSDRCVTKYAGLDRGLNNIVVNRNAEEIIIRCNEAFAGQPFTPDMIKHIYEDIRALLPSKIKKYKIQIQYKGKSIENSIPNIYRKRNIDKSRLWGRIEYSGHPWIKNQSRPFRVKHGLEGRHLAVGQSHGRYYSVADTLWKWQRPSLFCTTEDLFTQSIVVPLLIPMLENAGALVYTPRERDWQTTCVIVDNDIRRGVARYVEHDGKKNAWRKDTLGYAPLKELYGGGENPFTMGTSRVAKATDSGNRSEASAVWYPSIPEDGEYAVYVAYRTYENSVPDASYTVMHAGGSTVYKVNQKMGGGTWVYLGTHSFNAGTNRRQGVLLSSNSRHKGVVSADAVRFGGGMGNVVRGDSVPQTSGLPRFLEGARYNLQLAGFPVEVYSTYRGKDDYRDDINSRSHALNYLSGGSVYNPDTTGLNVPIELSLSFHSDAGFSVGDSLVGSLGVVTTDFECDTLAAGTSRYMSRDLATYLLNNLHDDIYNNLGVEWRVRGIIDRNYSESRIPAVPSVIFESLSHQNFEDLKLGMNPNFKFVMARSVYKSLLKHIAYVHGEKYIVQPLPVKNFSTELSKDGASVRLKWASVDDPLEPTAKAKSYVVYTKIGNGGFDNGTLVKNPHFDIPIEKNTLYSFKVAALNDGGCSMPSEVLSVYVSEKESPKVLIVNGFHRLDAPYTVSTEQKVGFDMDVDPGISYIRTPEFCGNQLDMLRENIGFENGLGLSGSELEGKLVAGNSFDYPYVHGSALAANGITFVSCSSDAVMSDDVDISNYDAVDIILGVEKQGGRGVGLAGYSGDYKTFPLKLQERIKAYCASGGRLFVSGAYIASDMYTDEHDREFIRDVLHLDYGGTVFDTSEDVICGTACEFPVLRGANEMCYAVPSPDILVPIDDAFVSFVYKGNRKSAGVAYSGKYRVLSTAFPFEAIADGQKREKIMGAIMRFLLK